MERTDLEQWKSRDVARLLALVETQRRYYQEIVASLPVALVVLSSDLEVILANAAARRTLGVRPGDAPPRSLDHFFPRSLLDRITEVLNTGSPETGIVAEIEHNGPRQVRVAILPIHGWDLDAPPEALVTIEASSGVAPGSVVAAPVRSESVTQVQPGFSPSALIDNLSAVLWAVELPSMRFVYVSPQAEALLGFPIEHWRGSQTFWTDRVHPEDRDSVTQGYRSAIDNGQSHSIEFRSVTADGRVLWLRESAKLLPAAEGQPRYLAGITIDLTERRLIEDQLVQSERVDAIAKLASRMAHDLNNMLMVQNGYVEEMENQLPAGSPLKADIQEIKDAADRISAVTRRLVAFAHKEPVETTPTELEPLIEVIGRGLTARGPRVSIEIGLAQEHSWVPANARQFEQVLTSILDRVRPAPAGQCTVTIQTSVLEIREDTLRASAPLKPGTYAVTAIGVPGPVPQGDGRACLFECLVPGRDPWDESAAALSRAYGVIRQWGGDLAVSGGPNQACVYRIFLPRLEAGSTIEPAATAPAAPEPEPERPTIFVVEDEPGIRALIRKMLQRERYKVLEASNGEEALAVAGQHPGKIDLLVTDMAMPEIGGLELADRLRELGRVTQVLFVSGNPDQPLPQGSAFLQKPFTLRLLVDKVKEILGT